MSEEKKHNRLSEESSPYLLQHAGNPIWWRAYSAEALEEAKKEGKLVIISIGYAACHWCHVMEEESFEDAEVAAVMNEHYVSIKVDREERPDVDHIYIEAVQLMNGNAGWPLNVVTLPDGRPVWGGTYFPKEQWIDALNQIRHIQENDPGELIKYANRLEEGLKVAFDLPVTTEHSGFENLNWERILKIFKLNLDKVNGGFGTAPKFMLPGNLAFLLKYAVLADDEQVSAFVMSTLEKMAQRGIFDQIEGGFARYSTDATWRIPHFEKMLYDNAQLISLYSDAHKLAPNPLFSEVITNTLDFISENLSDASGAFYSSLDADSLNSEEELEEGAYYTFTLAELKNNIEDFELFSQYYYILPESEWEGRYILHRRFSDKDFCHKFGITEEGLGERRESWIATLRKIRNTKSKPRLDDKSLTSWNALMLSALLNAYTALGEEKYLQRALENADFLKRYQIKQDFTLYRNYKNGKASINGFLEDYAWTISAFIRLYEVTGTQDWLSVAQKLLEKTTELFWDEDKNNFLYVSKYEKGYFIQPVDFHDDVIPSANSEMATNLFILGRYFGNSKYEVMSKTLVENLKERIEAYPTGFTNWLNLMLNFTGGFYEVAIIGKDASERRREFLKEYLPNSILASSEKEEDIPLLQGRFKKNKTRIFLCQNHTCQKPTENLNQVINQIKNR